MPLALPPSSAGKRTRPPSSVDGKVGQRKKAVVAKQRSVDELIGLLPKDVWFMIFDYLSLDKTMGTGRVCRAWRARSVAYWQREAPDPAILQMIQTWVQAAATSFTEHSEMVTFGFHLRSWNDHDYVRTWRSISAEFLHGWRTYPRQGPGSLYRDAGTLALLLARLLAEWGQSAVALKRHLSRPDTLVPTKVNEIFPLCVEPGTNHVFPRVEPHERQLGGWWRSVRAYLLRLGQEEYNALCLSWMTPQGPTVTNRLFFRRNLAMVFIYDEPWNIINQDWECLHRAIAYGSPMLIWNAIAGHPVPMGIYATIATSETLTTFNLCGTPKALSLDHLIPALIRCKNLVHIEFTHIRFKDCTETLMQEIAEIIQPRTLSVCLNSCSPAFIRVVGSRFKSMKMQCPALTALKIINSASDKTIGGFAQVIANMANARGLCRFHLTGLTTNDVFCILRSFPHQIETLRLVNVFVGVPVLWAEISKRRPGHIYLDCCKGLESSDLWAISHAMSTVGGTPSPELGGDAEGVSPWRHIRVGAAPQLCPPERPLKSFTVRGFGDWAIPPDSSLLPDTMKLSLHNMALSFDLMTLEWSKDRRSAPRDILDISECSVRETTKMHLKSNQHFRLANLIAIHMKNAPVFLSAILLPLLRADIPIDTIDISDNHFAQNNLRDIFRALAVNTSVKHVILKRNGHPICPILLDTLMKIIATNRSLITLDLTDSCPEAPPTLITRMTTNADVATSMYDIYVIHCISNSK